MRFNTSPATASINKLAMVCSTTIWLTGRLWLMWRLSSSRILRIILAPALSLWVAGAGCMLGCEGMVAAAAARISNAASHHEESSKIVATGHACSSGEKAQSHDCCKGTAKSQSEPKAALTDATIPSATESQSGTMNACPLAVSRAAVVSKTRVGDISEPAAAQQSLRSSDVTREQTAPLSSPLRLPNRGHTYLRCCVFLI